jgi:hypothetical protein
MKNRFIVLLGIFALTFISTELVAQNLSLSGDAVLFVHSKGLVVSTGSLKLSGNSKVYGVETIILKASEFI